MPEQAANRQASTAVTIRRISNPPLGADGVRVTARRPCLWTLAAGSAAREKAHPFCTPGAPISNVRRGRS
jgi:hypothetical protein